MMNLYTGDGVKHISKANIKSINIYIPSLEKQNEIVKYCENNDNNIKILEKEIENNKERMLQYMKDCKKIKEYFNNP
jgi:restriction endonuclease S subunit